MTFPLSLSCAMLRRLLPLALLLTLISAKAAPPEAGSVWDKLRQGGYVVVMRHAATDPGIGDPPGFQLDNCATQRNLSAEGRAQATRTGNTFRAHQVTFAEVRNSAWCRCIDTATLVAGHASPWPALNSFFDDPAREKKQTADVLTALRAVKPPANWLLVTHQVNITALTGEVPASGEAIVIRPPQRAGQKAVVVGKLPVE